MIDMKIGTDIKAKGGYQKYKKKQLNGFADVHITFIKILLQPQGR